LRPTTVRKFDDEEMTATVAEAFVQPVCDHRPTGHAIRWRVAFSIATSESKPQYPRSAVGGQREHCL